MTDNVENLNMVIAKLSNSNEFKKIANNISNNIIKLNNTISDNSSENIDNSSDSSENIDNSLDNVLGMFFLDKNGNNICDCINNLTNIIEKYQQQNK